MSLDAEALADRRRLQRRLSFWRIVAIFVVLALIFSITSIYSPEPIVKKQHIARMNISGMIVDDREQQELLRKIAEAEEVKALILHINSPGGTTTGGEALYEAIRKVSEKKPVVAVFGTIATSAAYITGLATDRIVARGNTITGSVGVIMQWTEVSKLFENVGVKVEEIKSGHLKANPSPFQPADEEGKRVTREMILDSQEWFLGLVRDRRDLDPASVPGLVDGRIYSGRQALKNKLVDEIGGEDKAVSWLENKKSVTKKLEIRDWSVKKIDSFGIFGESTASIAKKLGIPVDIFNKNLGLERLRLDGMVSVWHPSQK